MKTTFRFPLNLSEALGYSFGVPSELFEDSAGWAGCQPAIMLAIVPKQLVRISNKMNELTSYW